MPLSMPQRLSFRLIIVDGGSGAERAKEPIPFLSNKARVAPVSQDWNEPRLLQRLLYRLYQQ